MYIGTVDADFESHANKYMNYEMVEGTDVLGQNDVLLSSAYKVKYELHYNIKRLLDSAIMGQYSVKSVNDSKLYNMSIK